MWTGWGSLNILIEGNLVTGNTLTGINPTDSQNVVVKDNFATGNGQSGIGFHRISTGQILNNVANSNQEHGINTFESSDLLVQDNTAEFNTGRDYSTGINIGNSTRITTINNQVDNNRNGITYYNVTGTLIENNRASGQLQNGIGIYAGTNDVEIRSNDLRDNAVGFSFENNGPGILIYNNYLNNSYDAGFPVPGTTGITWNIPQINGTNIIGGPNLGGNYWSRPDGSGWSQTHLDTNGDGFSEEAYPLQWDTSNTDLLPLAYPGTGPLPLQAQFVATPDSGVPPLHVQFTDQSTGEFDTWIWDLGDGMTSTDQNPGHTYNNVGVFGVRLTVTNTQTHESSQVWKPIYVRPQVADGVPIWIGWNFISIPSSLSAGNDTASIFSSVATDGKPIWSYNATSKQWRQLLADDQLQTLEGYWIYSNQVGPYIPYHYDTSFGGKTPRVKTLETGWNAIGLGSLYGGPVEGQLSTLGEKWQIILNFDSGLQTYYPPAVRGQTNGWGMEPTKGYWIYMSEPGDMVAVTG
jgi:parallel beta-helix repeat protein